MSKVKCQLLVANGDAHRAGGAGDDLHRGFDIVGVQVGHLLFGDLSELGSGQNTDLLFVGHLAAGFEVDGLFDQLGGWGRLGDEGETAILVHGDDHWHDAIPEFAGSLVEFSAEILNVHAMLAQSGTDWRCRVGATGRNLQFNDLFDSFSHKSEG